MKTFELIGPALDWAVAKAEGLAYRHDDKYGPMCFRPSTTKGVVAWDSKPLPYSTDWSQGGPIIEREGITVASGGETAFTHQRWTSYKVDNLFNDDFAHESQNGPTPLIAAMRCYVASKLGDEVEIPEGLL